MLELFKFLLNLAAILKYCTFKCQGYMQLVNTMYCRGTGLGVTCFQDPQTGWIERQTETDDMGNKRSHISHMICSLT